MRIGKVLVTGAGGLLGSYVVDALEGRCEVSGLDLIASRKPIPFTKASIEDFAVVAAAAKGQDSIVHIAARPNIWSGSGSEIVATNTVGTWNVRPGAGWRPSGDPDLERLGRRLVAPPTEPT